MHGLGVWHFDQIAGWSQDNARWAGSFMAFPGRIEREDWIGQARLLARGEKTEHARKVISGEIKPEDGDEPGGAQPAAAAPDPELDGKYSGQRPPGLQQARDNEPDDLLKIKGVGKANLKQLHALGIFHFDQVAAWSKDEIKWVGGYLAFPKRIEKEDWVGQSKVLARRRIVELAARSASKK